MREKAPKPLLFTQKKCIFIGMFRVAIRKKAEKAIESMPQAQSERLYKLVSDLEQKGPVRAEWPNYSKIKGTNTHHCHLSHHWVACWVETLKGIEIEVTYAGSRESAPYA
jgi:hypothetical protein